MYTNIKKNMVSVAFSLVKQEFFFYKMVSSFKACVLLKLLFVLCLQYDIHVFKKQF